ncbi:MAG: hypothetical protein K2J82_05445 [Muribaculaceae bacterium]|nr:hypothetical protein [Muribaculaceae bacterium]
MVHRLSRGFQNALHFRMERVCTKTNLYGYKNFYEMFPKIFHAASGKSKILLSWTHYRTLIQELNNEARAWYEQETLKQNWSTRTLQRNSLTGREIRYFVSLGAELKVDFL